MEQKKIVQWLVPAGAAAAVVVLIGVLISLSDWGGSSAGKPPEKPSEDDLTRFPHFSLTAPEWKPVDEAKFPGLKSWDVVVGAGAPVQPGASVTIHYTGWTLDGKKFDSSLDRGAPATFGLGSLIQGWQAGIPGMMPGGKRRLLIPYQFGYGLQGSPPKIPAKAMLVFEIDLQ